MALCPSLSPGLVGPESECPLLLGADNVSALILVFRGDNDPRRFGAAVVQTSSYFRDLNLEKMIFCCGVPTRARIRLDSEFGRVMMGPDISPC